MKALRYQRYGSAAVLEVAELPEPECRAGEFKVHVHAAGLNPLDWKIRAGHLARVPRFERPPRGVGVEFAGVIVGVGGGATRHYVGQRVFGALPPTGRQGSLAEFVVASGDHLAAIPDGVDFEAAAALPIAGGTAVLALEDHAALQPGAQVLITGAGGGVGHYAVQLAKHLGATVTAVCGPGNVDFVRSLGADAVVDYTREDFLRPAVACSRPTGSTSIPPAAWARRCARWPPGCSPGWRPTSAPWRWCSTPGPRCGSGSPGMRQPACCARTSPAASGSPRSRRRKPRWSPGTVAARSS